MLAEESKIRRHAVETFSFLTGAMTLISMLGPEEHEFPYRAIRSRHCGVCWNRL